MHIKKSPGRKAFDFCNYLFLGVMVACSLYPILNQVAISFTSANGIMYNTITIFPVDFTLDTYKGLLEQSDFWLKYKNSIVYTIAGTSLGLFMTTTMSYALAKRGLYGANVITKMVVFTMFFGGGLIPHYFLIQSLGMIDTIWALIVPGCIAPYNVLLMRTFFRGLPVELEEASRIDGLGQLGHFLKIALPLSKPIIATMILFISVVYWNDWFAALIYINTPDKQPVTLYLRNVLMGATMAAQSGEMDGSSTTIPQSIQAASTMLVITPVLCVYPFVQKYFVQGVMIGAVKG